MLFMHWACDFSSKALLLETELIICTYHIAKLVRRDEETFLGLLREQLTHEQIEEANSLLSLPINVVTL